MKLEGKLKEGFFEWFNKVDWGYKSYSGFMYQIEPPDFDYIPQSAQFGLIQEYADSIGYNIVTGFNLFSKKLWNISILDKHGKRFWHLNQSDLPEAQIKAVEQLNEIVNRKPFISREEGAKLRK